MRILITGATGCVGRYLVDRLLNRTDHTLVLAMRNPAKLAIAPEYRDRVVTVQADLRDIDVISGVMEGVDKAVLIATAWGGAEAHDIIRNANLALTERLVAAGCQHVLYFGTASVLAGDGSRLAAADVCGTPYIKAKAALVDAMEALEGPARITGLFPTLVVGGNDGSGAPQSHFAGLIRQIAPWVRLIRFLSADGRFHIVHAADIAAVTAYYLETPPPAPDGPERIVLGNPAQAVDELVAEFAAYLGLRHRPLLRLRPGFAEVIIRLFRIQLAEWDRYCMEHPDQSFAQARCPADFGLPMAMGDLGDGLRMIGVRSGR